MNKIVENLKKTLLNRNAVTILAVIAGVIVLWFVYSATLSKAVNPQRVPVANKDLTAGTIITKEDITYVEVNKDVLKKANVITSSAMLIGYYVTNGTSIANGAMFYKDQVVDKGNLIERDLEIIPQGYRIYWLGVTNESTYANSIYPGDKIDLWLKTTDDDGKHVYEKFITSIDVLSVKDGSGKNVFDVDNNSEPKFLAFAVTNEMWTYLKNIEYLKDLQLFPVPMNKMYTVEGAPTEYANDQLKYFIDSKVRQLSPTETTIAPEGTGGTGETQE